MHISIRSGLLFVALTGAAFAQPPSDEPLIIGDPRIVEKPKLGRFEPPDYPVASLRAGEEGEVKIRLCVTKAGQGHDVSLVESSGFPRLDDASVAWVEEMIFTPAQTEAGPVAVCGYEFSYVWSLDYDDSDDITFERYSAQPLFVLGPTTRGKPMFPELKDMAGATAPVIVTTPDEPLYPAAEDPAYAFAREAPVKIKACVGSTGRTMMLTRMSEMGPMATIFATNWLNGVRFTPAMKDGKAIGVCGVDVEMRWKAPG